MNEVHEFRLKSRGEAVSKHLKIDDETPNKMRLIGKHYEKDKNLSNCWIGEASIGAKVATIVIPKLNLDKDSAKNTEDVTRANVLSSET